MAFEIMHFWENLIYYEINFILFLKNIYGSHLLRAILNIIYNFLEPVFIRFFYIPIVGMFRLNLMVDLMVTTEIASFVASVFNMITQTDRPFWMIKESKMYFYNYEFSKLYHDLIRCDASSGFPSIHTTLLTVLLLQKQKHELNLFAQKPKINKFIWQFVFCTLIGLMCLSQQYYGSHFLYQCLCGIILGFYVVKYYKVYKTEILCVNKTKGFFILSLLGLLVAITYIIKRALGFDPHYGTRMAFKWCRSIDLLSSKTTELYLIFGNLGTLSGIALVLPLNSRVYNDGHLYLKRSIPIVIASVILKLFMQKLEPRDKGKIMYLGWRFLANCIASFITIYILSKFALKEDNVIQEPRMQSQDLEVQSQESDIQPEITIKKKRGRPRRQLIEQ